MEPREPDFGVLHFIQDHQSVRWVELVKLWYRVQNYEALESIVDIAASEHISLQVAEEWFNYQWQEKKQASW